jgi:hypothetical protein
MPGWWFVVRSDGEFDGGGRAFEPPGGEEPGGRGGILFCSLFVKWFVCVCV